MPHLDCAAPLVSLLRSEIWIENHHHVQELSRNYSSAGPRRASVQIQQNKYGVVLFFSLYKHHEYHDERAELNLLRNPR